MPKNWEEAGNWLEQGAATPLAVACPRCGRLGAVTRDGGGEFRIEWRDEANGWTWRDAAVTADELRSPEFGCGYDRRANDGFVGGAPLLERP